MMASLFQRAEPVKDDPFQDMDNGTEAVEMEEEASKAADRPFRILREMFPNLDPDVLEDLWDSSLGDVEACINAALLVSGGKDHKSSRGGGGRRGYGVKKNLGRPGGVEGCLVMNRGRWETDGAAALFTAPSLSTLVAPPVPPSPPSSSSSACLSDASTSRVVSAAGEQQAAPRVAESAWSEEGPEAGSSSLEQTAAESSTGGAAQGANGYHHHHHHHHPGVRRRGNAIELPDSFLRLPRCCLVQAKARWPDKAFTVRTSYSVTLSKTKGVRGGLGVTVEESQGKILVKALPRDAWDEPNQAERAGVRVGDLLEGIDAQDFSSSSTSGGVALDRLIHLVRSLPEQVTLHLVHVDNISPPNTPATPNGADGSLLSSPAPGGVPRSLIPTSYHRLAQILLDEGVADHEQAFALTKMMMQIQLRERMWEQDSFASLVPPPRAPLAGHGSPHRGLQLSRRKSATDAASKTSELKPFLLGGGSPNQNRRASSSSVPEDLEASLLVSTRDLRRAMMVRIVATDFVEDHTVYVMDVSDVQTGSRWKVRRRFREFYELQEKCVSLRPSVSTLDFPMRRPTLTESISVVHTRKVMLNKYLRRLAGLLFYAPLHRSSCAMLKLLQDFLDVPSRLETLRILDVRAKTEEQGLVASLEVLVHRVLNMPVMDRILTDFTDHLAAAGAEEDLFGLGATVGYHSGGMKGQEMLEQLRRFMDHLQTCLMDGCGDELRPLVLARYPDMCPDDVDNLVSAAIRRQVEGHVYSPVMAKLIDSLRRDDADAKLEATVRTNMQAAKVKPQTFFGIPPHQVSPSGWRSAVLRFNGVVERTLPCDKLASLVEAAKDIPRIYRDEHPHAEKPLGADEFLPIFIWVVSQSDIEDLYLLKDVLCYLCDPNKRLSEVGYYLASFEAAIEHLVSLSNTSNDSSSNSNKNSSE